MVPGDAGEAAELGENGALDLLGEDEVGELQRRVLVDAVGEDHAAGEAAGESQVLELHEAGGLGEDAGVDRLDGLVGPGGDHGDGGLAEELERLGVAGGVGALVEQRGREVLEDRPRPG